MLKPYYGLHSCGHKGYTVYATRQQLALHLKRVAQVAVLTEAIEREKAVAQDMLGSLTAQLER